MRPRPIPAPNAPRRARLLALALSASAAAVACGRSVTGPADFGLSTRRAAYAAGDTVGVVVSNRSGRDVTLGACEAYAVDQRAGDAWREVYHSPDAVLCIMVAILLPADGTVSVVVRLPQALTPAEYRVRLARFEPAATNTFEVH